jgi:hypothetical protein
MEQEGDGRETCPASTLDPGSVQRSAPLCLDAQLSDPVFQVIPVETVCARLKDTDRVFDLPV